MTRLRAALDATASFTSFATELLKNGAKVDESFEVSDRMMDDFQVYMSERNIRPGVSEWSVDRPWMRSRLKQELFNLALGVEKGDEVELRMDPQVAAAGAGLGL